MAQYTAFAQYYIYFRNEAAYDAAVALYGTGFILAPPTLMGTLLGIINYGTTLTEKGITAVGYSLTGVGSEISHPTASGIFLSPSVFSVVVPGQLGGDDMLLKWLGIIIKAPTNQVTTVNIPQRRWGGGFEVAQQGEGGSGPSAARCGCRDAARVAGSLGWAFRDESNLIYTRTTAGYGTPTNAFKSWERFYIRLRAYPVAAKMSLWRCRGAISSTSGVLLSLNTDGTILAENRNSADTVTVSVTGTTVLALNTWYKIDILLAFNPAASLGSGDFKLYINRTTTEFDFAPTSGNGGLGQAGGSNSHIQTDLGDGSGTAAGQGCEIDIDSWENSEYPAGTVKDNIDWLMGTHYAKQETLSGTAANWTPSTEVKSFNQMISPLGSATESRYVSTTSGAALVGLTDINELINNLAGFSIGIINIIQSLYASRAGTANGTLGYKLAGGASVLTTIVQSGSTIFNTVAYRPSGTLLPATTSPFSITHEKAASVDSSTVLALQAIAGYIGNWGNEDDPKFIAGFTRKISNHNAYWDNTPWGHSGPYPDGPCNSAQGTYTGNATTQDINLPLPCHFLWIRALTGGIGGIKWFGAGLGGHASGTDTVQPDSVVRIWNDAGQPKFTVTGAGVQTNKNAIVYQYVAFCDPGMRYNICGAWRHQTSLVTATNPLEDSTFLPEAVFSQSDNLNIASATINAHFKGPGNTANVGQKWDGTAQASYMTLNTGSITSRANTHLAAAQFNYSAWRTTDGSGYVMVQILQYTGNGTNPRTITLTPTSGRTPIFVWVQGVNAIGHFRDPSHTGTNSCDYALTNLTTAIIALGVDSIQVQSTLNSNGVVYNVFAILPGPAPNIRPPGDFWFLAGNALPPNLSGIYTMIPGRTRDTFTDFATLTTIDVKIPNPTAKTGYIGG